MNELYTKLKSFRSSFQCMLTQLLQVQGTRERDPQSWSSDQLVHFSTRHIESSGKTRFFGLILGVLMVSQMALTYINLKSFRRSFQRLLTQLIQIQGLHEHMLQSWSSDQLTHFMHQATRTSGENQFSGPVLRDLKLS